MDILYIKAFVLILLYMDLYLAQQVSRRFQGLTRRNDERRRTPASGHRQRQRESKEDSCSHQTTDIRCDRNARYRNIDGSCNNLRNPTWGQAKRPMARLLKPEYNKGSKNDMRSVGGSGRPLPSTRKVSTTVHRTATTDDFSPTLTAMHMLWGQFIDHDITHTPQVEERKCCGRRNSRHEDCIPIAIPRDDPFWGTKGEDCMEMRRSKGILPGQCGNKRFREQINKITSYLDAGAVYGVTDDRTKELRSFSGGRMIITADGLPTEKRGTECNIPRHIYKDKRCFAAGDTRSNVWASLIAVHELFVKEHNRIADMLHPEIVRKHFRLTRAEKDEKTFQETKRIISALLQVITYREYLPNVLDANSLRRFGLELSIDSGKPYKYKPKVNAAAANVFATAAFRFGHAEIPFGTTPVSRDFQTNTTGFIPYEVLFNQPQTYRNNGAFGPFLRSVTVEPAMSISGTGRFSADVRDELFIRTFRGAGLDLPALNAQRGRDHGLPPYNKWRRFCGLTAVTFSRMPDHTEIMRSRFSKLYADADDIDLYPAAVTEIPLPGAHVGPTFACLLGIQFQRIKDGDRFWFESQSSYRHPFTSHQIRQLSNVRLSKLICENTGVSFVPQNVFMMNSPMVPCSQLPGLDLSHWTTIS